MRRLPLLVLSALGIAAVGHAQDASLEPRRAEVFAAVLAAWRPLFDSATAPFSWEPDQVEVLAGGDLALSTGLVHGPDGAVTARFNTIWRRQPDGRWRVVFDKGGPPGP